MAADRLSCYPWKCNHLMCVLESHNCANQQIVHHYQKHSDGVSHHTVFKPNFPRCDGSKTHQSVRVHHGHCHAIHGCKERVCAHGHRCGMGFLTGDKAKCECMPTHTLAGVKK